MAEAPVEKKIQIKKNMDIYLIKFMMTPESSKMKTQRDREIFTYLGLCLM
jgi:hypothetical protein